MSGEYIYLDQSLNWSCGFSPKGVPECLAPATHHGFRLTKDRKHIECMMSACDAHKASMKADYEHPMESACGIPGSYFKWPENYCFLKWDESPEYVAGRLEIHV